MHACKNTTINRTKSNVNQTASKIHVTEVLCDDVFVRKKCLITCLSKKPVKKIKNLFFQGEEQKLSCVFLSFCSSRNGWMPRRAPVGPCGPQKFICHSARVGDRPLENGAKGFCVRSQDQTDRTKNKICNLGNF